MLPLLCLLSVATTCTATNLRPLNTVVAEYGYPLETHKIHTRDHYILTYHRVPHGKADESRTKRTPVLLVHGIFISSCEFLSRNTNLPYTLANAGFDVWIANYRGNYYSRKHETLDPVKDKSLFWNYTLTELVSLDLPAGIDYILAETHHQQLAYVGGSMGTTMFWILGATRPEYMSKISLMVAIAPVARLSHMSILKNPLKYRIVYNDLTILKKLGYFEVKLYKEGMRSIMESICNSNMFKRIPCRILVRFWSSILNGLDLEGLKKLLVIPASSISTNALLHYVQISKARKFQMFDYGENVNMKLYNSRTPSEYDLKRVTCPVYLIYSNKDEIATVQDTEWLMQHLPRNPTRLFESTLGHFTHADFVVDEHAPELLFNPLTKFMKDYYIKDNN